MSHSPPVYSAINFIVRNGAALALVVGVLPLAGSLIAFYAGLPWWVMPVGLAASGLLYLVMKSYVELVYIMSDMLIPK